MAWLKRLEIGKLENAARRVDSTSVPLLYIVRSVSRLGASENRPGNSRRHDSRPADSEVSNV
jgi:hypothetical protein